MSSAPQQPIFNPSNRRWTFKAGPLAGAVMGVFACVGPVLAQPGAGGPAGGRDGKTPARVMPVHMPANPGHTVMVVPGAPAAQPKAAKLVEEDKKLTPEEKAQMRRLLKSGQ